MANTPEGTPYVESSDLVANYPAASLALANRVDLVGVLPFEDAAARTTAISSPTDGQYSYLQDTNATEFWNGSAWVAASVAPGLVHINTSAFSAVGSVSLNNVFTSTYNNYIIWANYTLVSNAYVLFRLRVGGSNNTAANYAYNELQATTGTVTSARETGITSTRIGYNNASVGGFATVQMSSPALAVPTLYTSTPNRETTPILNLYSGLHTASTAFDGITFYPSTGNFTGTIRVYGYKNS